MVVLRGHGIISPKITEFFTGKRKINTMIMLFAVVQNVVRFDLKEDDGGVFLLPTRR